MNLRSLFPRERALFAVTLCILLFIPPVTVQAQQEFQQFSPQRLDRILDYIANSWNVLSRSMTNCATLSDPKTKGTSTLYFPKSFAMPEALDQLLTSCAVRLAPLPVDIRSLGQPEVQDIQPSGLLYLTRPYVVPGGRFNEMYGWDSYFIIRGLLREGRIDLARGIVENFFFEIQHYGGVLNANRTYYLTRSQPPFLTSMILAVYDAEKTHGRDDLAWLREAYPLAVRDHALWISDSHRAGTTGLSRYFDFGKGPVPEMADSPAYYRGVAEYFVRHPTESVGVLLRDPAVAASSAVQSDSPVFNVSPCSPRSSQLGVRSAVGTVNCNVQIRVALSPEYYKGDRSMRESGFDTSFRFGPYGAFTHHYAPVDLNSLIYKTERDLAQMASLIGREPEAQNWRDRAEALRHAMNRYLWNAAAGLYFDYDYTRSRQSKYVDAATLYPLWGGLASKDQANAVGHHLKDFEQPGGLATSTQDTGVQWDFPYGWAPIQLIAVEGLRRYGFSSDADRISREFLSTVLLNFERDGTIREKYDVVHRSAETHIEAGYTQNVIGFGWTNAVFLELLHELPTTGPLSPH
jgi:alpha,alpha-trehalase